MKFASISSLGASIALAVASGGLQPVWAEANSPSPSAAALTQTTPIASADLETFTALQLPELSAGQIGVEDSVADNIAPAFVDSYTAPVSESTDAKVAAPQTIARLDLELLCKNFPLNSRCQAAPEQPAPEAEQTTPEAEPQATVEKKGPTSGFALAPSISTTGFGVEATKSVIPHLNARVSANLFSFKFNSKISNIKYNAKLNLQNISLIGDIYPWKKNAFHVSTGLALSDNNLDGVGKPAGSTFVIGGNTYTVKQVGKVKAKASYPGHVSPYLGIGWGNPVAFKRNLSVNINAGVLFTGAPSVEFEARPNPSLPEAVKRQIRRDIRKEQNQLNSTLDKFSIYPVISVSVSYQF